MASIHDAAPLTTMTSLDALHFGEDSQEAVDPICKGCKLELEETSVICLGGNLWHVDCFRCAKCRNLVQHETNVILLSDGYPVCTNCSYVCCVCNLPINNEAIVTGDESYHSECFRCKSCQQRMDELIFARTGRGIYCMPCHNERVARSRKAEAKKRGDRKDKSARVRTPTSAASQHQDNFFSSSFPMPISNSQSTTNNSNGLQSPVHTPNGTYESFATQQKESHQNVPSSSLRSQRPKQTQQTPTANNDSYFTLSTTLNGSSGSRPGSRDREKDDSPIFNQDQSSSFGAPGASLERRTNGRRPAFTQSTHHRQQSSSSEKDKDDQSLNVAPSRNPNRRSGFYGAGLMEDIGRSSMDQVITEKSVMADSGRDRSKSEPMSVKMMDSIAENEKSVDSDNSVDSPLTAALPVQAKHVSVERPTIPPIDNSSMSFYDPDILVFLDAVQDPDFGNAPPNLPIPSQKETENEELSKSEAALNSVTMQSQDSGDQIERLQDEEVEKEDDHELLERVKSMVKRKKAGEAVELDVGLLEKFVARATSAQDQLETLQRRFHDFRRASRTAFEGFSMAREEYDKEVASRKEMETLLIRLQHRLAEQASHIAKLDKANRDSDAIQRRSVELKHSVDAMGDELSRLRLERDMTVAEMEELAVPSDDNRPEISLAARLEAIKEDHRLEILELVAERDNLVKEIAELRQTRDIFAEETTSLNTRNVELSEQNMDVSRRLDDARAALNKLQMYSAPTPAIYTANSDAGSGSSMTTRSASIRTYESASIQSINSQPPMVPRKGGKPSEEGMLTLKKRKNWLGKTAETRTNGSISKPAVMIQPPPVQPRNNANNDFGSKQHVWQQTSILRPVRCEFCGDKMWGLQEYRCAACMSYCHAKCTSAFTSPCRSLHPGQEEGTTEPAGPSLFGNDLTAQCILEDRPIPMIITKSIGAVEATGMEYEGIYRKTGGSAQTKLVTSYFEKGEPFDLEDEDKFNDMAAITSCFKNYLRSLPVPLFTFEHHESFMAVATMSEADGRNEVLERLLHMLPETHYITLKFIMCHLNRIHLASEQNKMTSSNLGVVFGPTLLRSSNPTREFADMGSKAKIVEILVENAVQLFSEPYQNI